MKQSKIIMTIIIIAAVALVALGIGLCINAIRHRHSGAVSGTTSELREKQSERRFLPGGANQKRTGNLSEEERARLKAERQKIIEQMQNLSEEQKEAFRAEVLEKLSFEQQEKQGGYRELTPEEKAKMREEWEKMKQRWEDMSEQERQEFMAQTRAKSDVGQKKADETR